MANSLKYPLRWRHNDRDGVSNHQPHDCLLNRLFRHRSNKHQSSASLAFVWGIHRGPVNSPHKGPVTRKMFPFDDVIMQQTMDPRGSVLFGSITCLVVKWPLLSSTVCESLWGWSRNSASCTVSKLSQLFFLWLNGHYCPQLCAEVWETFGHTRSSNINHFAWFYKFISFLVKWSLLS